jgi:hypothetical protein
MMRICNRLVIVVCLSLMVINAYACEKNNNVDEASVDARISDFSTCSTNEDCLTIKAECCGCKQGGKQKAINKSASQAMLASMEQACTGTICMQMISTDATCSKVAACVEGECVLR